MVYLENNQSKISAEWSEILPPAQLKNVRAILRPEKFTDFLLARPTEDYIDCFNKSSFYDENTTHYFNLSINEMASDIPRELIFLADLYSSWNNKNLTAAQFNEAELMAILRRKYNISPETKVKKSIQSEISP